MREKLVRSRQLTERRAGLRRHALHLDIRQPAPG
jgi:hypothetical protein